VKRSEVKSNGQLANKLMSEKERKIERERKDKQTNNVIPSEQLTVYVKFKYLISYETEQGTLVISSLKKNLTREVDQLKILMFI
jgi:hypothetical protein